MAGGPTDAENGDAGDKIPSLEQCYRGVVRELTTQYRRELESPDSGGGWRANMHTWFFHTSMFLWLPRGSKGVTQNAPFVALETLMTKFINETQLSPLCLTSKLTHQHQRHQHQTKTTVGGVPYTGPLFSVPRRTSRQSASLCCTDKNVGLHRRMQFFFSSRFLDSGIKGCYYNNFEHSIFGKLSTRCFRKRLVWCWKPFSLWKNRALKDDRTPVLRIRGFCMKTGEGCWYMRRRYTILSLNIKTILCIHI